MSGGAPATAPSTPAVGVGEASASSATAGQDAAKAQAGMAVEKSKEAAKK